MSTLRIAPGLRLDADYIGGGTLALLAKKGAGKSYTARVLAEEMWEAKIPFVLIDPMGTSWGLRAGADGDEAGGLPIPIFGGEKRGDAPLERTGGALMADLVVEEGVSMILDLSALGTRAAERQFAHDFFDRLYRTNRELVHLLVDEADLFAPQKPQPGDAPLLGVTENIVRRGRNRGIGITLITQRPAVLNKDVLTQVDGLVAMRIVGKQDRDAINEWVKGHADQEAAAEVQGTLASLANGECWWWIPELGILKRVQVRQSRTFDSSPTRRSGQSRREPKSLAEIDMGAIAQKMEATIERAKADDPKELRKQIADLKRELAQRPAETVEVPVETVVEVPTPVFNGEVERLEKIATDLTAASATLAGSADDVVEALAAVREESTRATAVADRRPAPSPRPARAQPRRADPPPPAADGFSPTGPQQKVLNALAWLESIGLEGDRNRIGFIAGYSPSSGGYKNLVSALRSAGAVEYPREGIVALTPLGSSLADHPDVAPTSEDIQQQVLGKLKNPQRKILRVLIDEYPNAITRDEIAERTGYSPDSGGYKNLVSSLRSLGVATYPQTGYVAADPVLFID